MHCDVVARLRSTGAGIARCEDLFEQSAVSADVLTTEGLQVNLREHLVAVAVAVVMIAMLIMRVSMFMAAIFVVNVPMLYALMMIVVRHGVPFTPMVHTPLHLVCSLSLVSRLSFDARALSRARVRSLCTGQASEGTFRRWLRRF